MTEKQILALGLAAGLILAIVAFALGWDPRHGLL